MFIVIISINSVTVLIECFRLFLYIYIFFVTALNEIKYSTLNTPERQSEKLILYRQVPLLIN